MKELGRIEFQDLRHKKIAASAHGGSLLQMLKDGEVIAELSYEQACFWRHSYAIGYQQAGFRIRTE